MSEQSYREKLTGIIGDHETSDERFSQMERYAKKDFADHEIEKVSDREYYCSRPNTGIMSFRVMFPPSAIIVYGDIGEMILTQHNIGLGWLRGSVHSRGYFFEKCRTKRRTFSPMDAAEHLDWYAEDDEASAEHSKKLWEAWDPEYREEYELEMRWYEACFEVGDEPIVCERYDWDDVRCYEALKWFVTTGLKKSHL